MRQLAVDVLAPVPVGQLLGRPGAGASVEARTRRRRLQLVITAQSKLLAKSPPGEVLQLLLFTAQVAAAVAAVKLRAAWARLLEAVRQLLSRGGSGQQAEQQQQQQQGSGGAMRPAFA